MSSLCTVSFAIGLAYGIGFPVPFMINMVASSGALVIAITFVLQLRTQLCQTSLSHAELQQFGYITNIQLGFGLAYPAYTTAFYKLSGVPQTLFALLLPVMKLAAKNWINIAIPHREDAKAESVNLNVEVYHAVFLACCLQDLTSFSTMLLIIAIDVVQACISLHDIEKLLDSFQEYFDQAAVASVQTATTYTRQAIPEPSRLDYLDAAVFILESDQSIYRDTSIRLHSHNQSNLGTFQKFTFSQVVQAHGPTPVT